MNSHLAHHGIDGQKWGVRNGPPYPIQPRAGGSDRSRVLANLKSAKTSNLNTWGKDAEHNVLYVVGYSGSGKSTTALGLRGRGESVIHLDNFIEGDPDYSKRDRRFSSFLDKNVPNWRELSNSVAGKSSIKAYSKEYWKIADDFVKAVNSYGISEFKNGRRVIAEGVQLYDDWWGDKSSFVGKPMIFLQTNAYRSMTRAFERDGRGNVFGGLSKLDSPKEYLKWMTSSGKQIKQLEKSVHAKRGKAFVDDFMKQYA